MPAFGAGVLRFFPGIIFAENGGEDFGILVIRSGGGSVQVVGHPGFSFQFYGKETVAGNLNDGKVRQAGKGRYRIYNREIKRSGSIVEFVSTEGVAVQDVVAGLIQGNLISGVGDIHIGGGGVAVAGAVEHEVDANGFRERLV